MTWGNEKGLYVDKLERINEGITKILGLKGNRVVTSTMADKMENLQERAQVLLPKLKTGEFEIAVVGLEKAGKSSFTNALIDLLALPTAEPRCTYTSTCIRSGAENSAEVMFYTRQEFDRDFSEKLEKLGIRDSQCYKLENLSLEKYRQLYENCDEEKQHLYGDNLNQDIEDTLSNKEELLRYIGSGIRRFSAEDLKTNEFSDFITSPGRAIAVKDVVIFSSELYRMPEAVIYDVPGFNSPTSMHREQTLQKMRSADAIIVVTKANEPSITGEVLSIFREADEDGAELRDKLFVFANKVDYVTDLAANKEETYREWAIKRKILPNTDSGRERIMFGSANAYLGDRVKGGEEIRRNLKEKNISNGIDEVREKLQIYYDTVRFEVLKKRIDKILYELNKMFEGVQSESTSVVSSYGSIEEYSKIALHRCHELEGSLKEQLENLKEEVNRKICDDRPLTENLLNIIRELITCEKYTLSDEEIGSIHREFVGIGSAQQPQKVDSKMREGRFADMYGKFVEQILNCTTSRHEDIRNAIIDRFMGVLGLDGQSSEYEVLQEKVRLLCGLDCEEDNGYYQSLIERFSRDLFEVQIKFSLVDRLHKFKEEASNFFSLGVFYNKSLSKKDDTAYLEESLKDSMFWRILLYPEYASMVPEAAVEDRLKQLTGLKLISGSVGDMLHLLSTVKGNQTIQILEEIFSGFVANSPEAVLLAAVKEKLESVLASCETDSAKFLKDVLTGNRYQEDIAQRHQNYTYEVVKHEFDQDILALQDVLQNAFVPAVNIDKAFSARETKLIEDMIRLLQGEAFREFIADNIGILEAAKVGKLQEEAAQKALDAAVMREIGEILSKISLASFSEMVN